MLVAALATEEPLLLIGAHGTAKSLLLTRIAQALAFEFRHHNASLITPRTSWREHATACLWRAFVL